MKKLLLTFFIATIAITSCKKDSNTTTGGGGTTPPPSGNSDWIVGTWDAVKVNDFVLTDEIMKMSYTFGPKTGEYSKGSFYYYFAMMDEEVSEEFLYKLDEANSKIIMKSQDGTENGELKIRSHTETTMTIEDYDEEEDELVVIEFKKR